MRPLLGSGAGSLVSGKIPSGRLWGFLWKAAGAVTVIQLGAWLFLPGVFTSIQGAGLGVKFCVVTLVLAVLAIPMGMVFPSLIRLAGLENLNLTCWVWGMNGVGSVLGSVTATVISMNGGKHITYLTGVVFYAGITVMLARLNQQGPPAGSPGMQEG